MIHSLAGGELGNIKYLDFAKVEITDSIAMGDVYWYISNITNLKVGDEVLVPFGINNKLLRGKVVRLDKHVSSQVSPIPVKRAKYISRVVKK